MLGKNGKPETVEELKNRINEYFQRCSDEALRPGIESLSAALCVSRQTFWRWCNGDINTGDEWRSVCESAKSTINAYLEQAMLTGKINPASGIFLMKNWMNYKDSISFEEALPADSETRITPDQIAARHGISIDTEAADAPLLPDADFLSMGGDEE